MRCCSVVRDSAGHGAELSGLLCRGLERQDQVLIVQDEAVAGQAHALLQWVQDSAAWSAGLAAEAALLWVTADAGRGISAAEARPLQQLLSIAYQDENSCADAACGTAASHVQTAGLLTAQ